MSEGKKGRSRNVDDDNVDFDFFWGLRGVIFKRKEGKSDA